VAVAKKPLEEAAFVVGKQQNLSNLLFFRYQWCKLQISMLEHTDIERKNGLLKVCYVPATSTTFLAFFSCCGH
jgi:hypothetical protein